jgi:Uma2 family endonuclease
MSAPSLIPTPESVIYPECDGEPMADDTEQYRYIVLIKENLEELFLDRPDVFVAGDLLWYAVEGQPTIRQAPDVMMAFGRPKGRRGSYLQWKEGGIAPQVVFEILSPGNRPGKMKEKFEFYQRHGVQEYYVFDPDSGALQGYERQGNQLVEVLFMQGWTSPRLQVRFEVVGDELDLIRPDGTRFTSFSEERRRAKEQSRRADEQSRRADEQSRRAEEQERQAERERAEKERALQQAERERAEKERALQSAEEQKRRAEGERAEKERALQRLAELERLLSQREPPSPK